MPGIYQKKDKAGSEHRNVRPNDRDQAAKGHNSADQQSIGKPENRHAQIDEEKPDTSLGKLTSHKIGKDFI